MSVDVEARGWDLSPVINLLHSLSPTTSLPRPYKAANATSPTTAATAGPGSALTAASSLGDFSKLWNSLGIPKHAPQLPSKVSTSPPQLQGEVGIDRALLLTPASVLPKGVRWKDEDGVADLEDNVGQHLSSAKRWEDRRDERLARALRRKKKNLDKTAIGIQNGNPPTSSDPESEAELSSLRDSPRHKYIKPLKGPGASYDDTEPSSTSPPTSSILKGHSSLPAGDAYVWKPPAYSIEPMLKLSSSERKKRLLSKLAQSFPLDSRYLLGGSNLTNTPRDPQDELHIFVDCSNVSGLQSTYQATLTQR